MADKTYTKKVIQLCLAHMGGKEQKFIAEAIESNWVTSLGPNVDCFEKLIEDFLSCSDIETGKDKTIKTLAVASGTAALHLALILLGVKKDDEVLCQSWTFAASVNPVIYQGARPVFIDSEESTWNLDPVLLEETIVHRISKTGRKPKAIIAVDLYGMPAKWDEINAIASKYDIPVLEDSAEAMGSQYKGRYCGTLGTLGVFSFNGNKMITTGAGGALICHDEKTRDKALYFATQARGPRAYYHHEDVGYNYRMSNISGAIGQGQMETLQIHIDHHRKLHDIYSEAFSDSSLIQVKDNPTGDFNSNFWLTTVLFDDSLTIDDVDRTREQLQKNGIMARPLWKPMHEQPVFKIYKSYMNGTSSRLWAKGLCLPSGPCVSVDDALMIADLIKDTITRGKR